MDQNSCIIYFFDKIVKEGNIVFDNYEYSVYADSANNRAVIAKNDSFHMLFMHDTGFTAKWGSTMDENPTHCPFGNEIADIEITTICPGIRDADGIRKPCEYCYKSNTTSGAYMDFDAFKTVFDKMDAPKTMTQIALGVDACCKTNPDAWKIMDYCNANGVVPNVTVADIDQDTASNIVSRCGACAVSCYERDKNRCYDSIELLVNESKKQNRRMKVNMHLLVGKETEKFVFEVLNDRLSDKRLYGMGAVVLLSLKQKGRGKAFHKMDDEVFAEVISFLEKNNIAYGSDSCGANRLVRSLSAIHTEDEMKQIAQCVEECESCMYSVFVNVAGEAFPCSFMEKEPGWEKGIDLLDDKYKNFTTQVWNHPRILEWRQNAILCINCNGRNQCPHYEI